MLLKTIVKAAIKAQSPQYVPTPAMMGEFFGLLCRNTGRGPTQPVGKDDKEHRDDGKSQQTVVPFWSDKGFYKFPPHDTYTWTGSEAVGHVTRGTLDP